MRNDIGPSGRGRRLHRLLAFLSLGMSGAVYVYVTLAVGPLVKLLLIALKLLAAALTYISAALGALSALLGAGARDPLSCLSGGIGAALAVNYVRRVTQSRGEFARAFGPDWRSRLSVRPGPPTDRDPLWDRDRVFWTFSPSEGDGNPLLCDLWRPPPGTPPSGIALVFLHGGGWTTLDKDTFTRPFFRHLAQRGHVVMDVAYRLYPEARIPAMVGDAKRAVTWMKANAQRYGADPARVVLAGGSAGGHLALLSAYTPGHPALTPDDVREIDTSVRAVVAFYPPVDLRAYRLYNPRSGVISLLGNTPDAVPALYDLLSPAHHVAPACPPTLLFHGSHDRVVPPGPVRDLRRRLRHVGVPAVYIELFGNEHGFDLCLPRLSPSAQRVWRDLDRFLALAVPEGGSDEP